MAGCGGKQDPPGGSPERFTSYYAEEMFLTERSRLTGGDSLTLEAQLDSLRSSFTLTATARDSFLAYYRDSLPRWERFLEDVADRLEARGGAGNKAGAPDSETRPDAR